MGIRGKSSEELIDQATDMCLHRGTRLTELRRCVLKLVLDSDRPLTAYQLLDQLRAVHNRPTPPTVYRALEFLMEQNLVHRIERLSAFIACRDPSHRHPVQFLICRQCKAVLPIADKGIVIALNSAAARVGFHPIGATVELLGLCAACTAGRAPTAANNTAAR